MYNVACTAATRALNRLQQLPSTSNHTSTQLLPAHINQSTTVRGEVRFYSKNTSRLPCARSIPHDMRVYLVKSQ